MTPVETVTGEPRPENARSAFSDDDERREAWQLHRDRLLAEHGEAWAALVYDKGLDHAAAYRALQPDDDPPASSLPVWSGRTTGSRSCSRARSSETT